MRKRFAELEQPKEFLDVDRAVYYLRDVGRLWAESPKETQREFVREVFARIVVGRPANSDTHPQTHVRPAVRTGPERALQGNV